MNDSSEPTSTSTPQPALPRPKKWVSWLLVVLGFGALLVQMASTEQLQHGALIALLFLVIGVVGVLQLQSTPTAQLRPWSESAWWPAANEFALLAPRIVVPIGLLVVLAVALAAPVFLPYAIAASLALMLPAGWRRPGLLVFVIVGFMYLPLLGTFALWDPWETHYGEVAREIISRDDWISLWWAHEHWFWSKPILIFWSEAFFLSSLGVDCLPDGNPFQPEWAIRLPVVLFSMVAVQMVFVTVKRYFSTRAGVLSALVLATSPHFFFLSHQAITDMYVVANVTIAVCAFALALLRDELADDGYKLFGVIWSKARIATALVLALALPQIFYLITRNFRFDVEDFSVAYVVDEFLFGSAGNPGGLGAGEVPGSPPFSMQGPAVVGFGALSWVQGMIWLSLIGSGLWMLRKDERPATAFMVIFYVFCALGLMGKGIPGILLPAFVVFFYLAAANRWNVMFRGDLHIGVGLILTMALGLPWFVAMFVRHGPGFTDRLIVHDHINRLAQGVHGDTGSIQYFIEQLGVGTFPWIGLVPTALVAWIWLRSPKDRGREGEFAQGDEARRKEFLILSALWFFSTFTLFSAMITKFHHYIFPVVPAAAVLSGIVLDRLWGKPRDIKVLAASALATALAVAGFGGVFGNLRGILPEGATQGAARETWGATHGMGPMVSWGLVALAVVVFAFALRLKGQEETAVEPRQGGPGRLGVVAALAAVVVAFVGRDLSWLTAARPYGYERLIHLFVYNYQRPWPVQFDYRPVLTGFSITVTVLFAVMMWKPARAIAARGVMVLALLFTTWTLNVYMVDLAPHWGMKELFQTYYAERSGPEEPILAWQMNWKGENFYTGNRVHVFVDLDNEKIRQWMDSNRGKTIFAVLERGRYGGFRSLMGERPIDELSTERSNNKFILVRVRNL